MTIQDPQPTSIGTAPKVDASAASNPPGYLFSETHETSAGDQTTTDGHRCRDTQDLAAVSGSNPPGGHCRSDAQNSIAAGDQATEGQHASDAQYWSALGSNHQQAIEDSAPNVGVPAGLSHPPTKSPAATIPGLSAGSNSTDSHGDGDTQEPTAVRGPILADPILGVAADVVGDLEAVRVANENRLRTLTATDEYGHGLSPEHPDVARLSTLVDSLGKAEHQAILNLQRVMRAHPLGAWVKAQPGVGEKQAARLLAVIRDPYWNDLHDRPRTVSELWAYCGFHVLPGGHLRGDSHIRSAAGSNVHPGRHGPADTHSAPAAGVAPKRQRGHKSNWNEDARKRAWLIAASCVKQPADTRWRKVYDDTRAKYADAVHQTACVRCGPKGKPAQPGTPLSLGHQHARGLRAIAKAILKDLWLEARALHQPTEGEAAA